VNKARKSFDRRESGQPLSLRGPIVANGGVVAQVRGICQVTSISLFLSFRRFLRGLRVSVMFQAMRAMDPAKLDQFIELVRRS
jgi:hypothetical protein